MHALLRLGPDLGALIFNIAFCELAFKKDDMAFYCPFFSYSADPNYCELSANEECVNFGEEHKIS